MSEGEQKLIPRLNQAMIDSYLPCTEIGVKIQQDIASGHSNSKCRLVVSLILLVLAMVEKMVNRKERNMNIGVDKWSRKIIIIVK